MIPFCLCSNSLFRKQIKKVLVILENLYWPKVWPKSEPNLSPRHFPKNLRDVKGRIPKSFETVDLSRSTANLSSTTLHQASQWLKWVLRTWRRLTDTERATGRQTDWLKERQLARYLGRKTKQKQTHIFIYTQNNLNSKQNYFILTILVSQTKNIYVIHVIHYIL